MLPPECICVIVMDLRTRLILPMKVPVHKIQTFFTIFVVVCTNDSCPVSKRSTLLVFLYLHRALNKVTQLANQHMHTFSFFIY